MDIIGITSIAVAIIIAIAPFLWRRYFSRPELTVELIKGGGVSSNAGVSNKNDTSKGYIDGNTAIYVFKVVWQFKVIIRNNSEIIAYYPKIILDTTNPKFTKIETLNELIPISTKDTIELNAEYTKYEECEGKDRSDIASFPEELKNIKILLEYKNASKIKRYTLYSHSDKTIIAVLILYVSYKDAFEGKKIIAGIKAGFFSGFGSGIVACLTALMLICFGMKLLLKDAVNIGEWTDMKGKTNYPDIASYFAYQTFAGAIMHLIILGIIMGVLLGVIGGLVGKIVSSKNKINLTA